jgi:hypothetical protein
VKRDLERVEIPDEHGARERTWAVVQSAFEERSPVEHRLRHVRMAVAFAVVLAIIGSAFSPPGAAVLDQIRDAVGVEHAAPGLFSLPAEGKLLVRSDEGIWVVQQDGSRRLLGNYRQANWSPFGRFVVATRQTELAALEPNGDVRWTLARPGPHDAAWGGTRTDTRIAYIDRSGLRIVAGDGKGDRLLVAGARGRLAWRTGSRRVLAYASATEVRVEDVDTRSVLWHARLAAGSGRVQALEWSSDGKRLLVLQPYGLRVYDQRGRVVGRDDPSDATKDADATFRPETREVGVIRLHGAQSTVFRLAAGGTLFSGTGVFDQVTWSPDRRWLLVSWPTADQWVFVRVEAGGKRIRAVANVSEQFRSGSFPRIEGWVG